MGLDIRLPIGLMFSILGAILVIEGLVGGTSLNTQTGGAMLAFGTVMLGLGLRGQRRQSAGAERARHEAESAPASETEDDDELAEAA